MTDVTASIFLELAARSRLLEAPMLARFAMRFPGASARELADALVHAGDLTHFQARKLLAGQWQGLAVGPYRILAPLGRGGMGTVYLARDSRLAEEIGDEILVALKILPPRIARTDERMLARFHREINMGKRVNHPNVARTLTGGEADGVNYLAMEYVPGKTLNEVVKQNGAMAVGDAARLFADVATGLAHLHERSVIHRDLKPANIMVMPDGRAKLLDLGLAYAIGDPSPGERAVVGGMGYILGTMDYISPEQARDATAVTPRSDLYSLGCSLYFALTGSPPFPGGTSRDKIRKQRQTEPPPLASLNPTVPVEFSRVVEWLMLKEPTGRPVSAPAVRELLLRFASTAAPRTEWSFRDAVGEVDRPEAHPDLWKEEQELLPLPLPDEEESRAPVWVIATGVGVSAIVLLVLLALLRRLF